MPQAELPGTALQYTRETVENLQLAYEVAKKGETLTNVLLLEKHLMLTYVFSGFKLVI